MELRIVGSSPSFPNPGAACSSYLVASAGSNLLLDCGHGAAGMLQTVFDIEKLEAVVISHMHPDHFFDLVPLKYLCEFAGGGPGRPRLYLPPGGIGVLQRLRTAVGLNDDFFSQFGPQEYEPRVPLHVAGVTVTFARTSHFVEGYALRIAPDGGGAELFYSSDTGWSDSVVDFARGAAVGLIEATWVDAPSAEKAAGHLTPRLAGELAREAGLRRLILTHFPVSRAEWSCSEASEAFGADVELAEPGKGYSIT